MKLDKCIYKGNKKSVYVTDGKAVKVFEPGYSKSDVLYEALNTARVEDAGMDIPKLLNVSLKKKKRQITSEYISGKTLSTLMKENPKYLYKKKKKMVLIQQYMFHLQ